MTALLQLWPIALSSAFVIVGMAFAYGLSRRGGSIVPELSPADQVAALRAEADALTRDAIDHHYSFGKWNALHSRAAEMRAEASRLEQRAQEPAQ